LNEGFESVQADVYARLKAKEWENGNAEFAEDVF
jgi:hypothetical protein